MGFSDFLSIFKKREITFIESVKEAEDVYSFLFRKDKDFTWKAGQYVLISITHKKIKNGTKPFSISSAPREDIIKITTRISGQPSEFKQALLELKKGMTVKISGPVGAFYLPDNSEIQPTLLIAGGIGITPIRSILNQLESKGSAGKPNIQVLYLDSQQTYPFKEELDRLAGTSSIAVSYLASREDLNREIEVFASSHKDKGNYYVAGPKSMVDSIAAFLQDHQIPKKQVKKDVFFGY